MSTPRRGGGRAGRRAERPGASSAHRPRLFADCRVRLVSARNSIAIAGCQRDGNQRAQPAATIPAHLPCRRSWVRVPSSAPQKAPLRRGFLRSGPARPRPAEAVSQPLVSLRATSRLALLALQRPGRSSRTLGSWLRKPSSANTSTRGSTLSSPAGSTRKRARPTDRGAQRSGSRSASTSSANRAGAARTPPSSLYESDQSDAQRHRRDEERPAQRKPASTRPRIGSRGTRSGTRSRPCWQPTRAAGDDARAADGTR
jgi:hypothetical protein